MTIDDTFNVSEYLFPSDFRITPEFAEEQRSYGSTDKKAFITKLQADTKSAAIAIINLFEGTPNSATLNTIRFQLIKSATSTAANYRAACRARSKKEFFAKMCIVVEECDETQFWLELLAESEIKIDKNQVTSLMQPWKEFLAIFGSAKAKSA